MTAAGTLAELVGDPEAFAREHWGRRPLLRAGAGDFAGLLALDDVDHLVSETLLRLPGMRLVKDGVPVPAATYTRSIRIGGREVRETVRPERVARAFAEGATIVLQALHRQWPPAARFCRTLESDLTHPVQANAYVTPPAARGFEVHHDTHDVFVLQTHGRKAWRVYEPLVPLAGAEQKWSRQLGDPGPPAIEVELAPGDALYIPRGFPHDADAQDEVSVHVTVGVRARTWLDVWRHVMAEAPEHAAFREALPIGYARDAEGLAAGIADRLPELRAWLDKTAGAAAPGFAAAFEAGRRPVRAGQLRQVAELDSVTEDRPVALHEGQPFAVSGGEGEAVVVAGDTTLRMPAFCLPALAAIARGPVRASELPGLDPASGLVLLRRLIREGLARALD